jgi:hypothetical protein
MPGERGTRNQHEAETPLQRSQDHPDPAGMVPGPQHPREEDTVHAAGRSVSCKRGDWNNGSSGRLAIFDK